MDKQELAKQQKLLKEKEKEAKKERKEKLKAMTPEERKAFLDEEKAERIKSFELAETEHAQKVEEKRKSMENSNGWSANGLEKLGQSSLIYIQKEVN